MSLAERQYLEMMAEEELRPSARASGHITVKQQTDPDPELGRYLYDAVGKDYHWTDRSHWTNEQWIERLGPPNVEMWVAYERGSIAGYFELFMNEGRNVEIAYFGLLPRFIGRGAGGHLLTAAARRAWQMGACRVWLHTSSRDHPHSLANYQGRGFRLFKKEALEQSSSP